MEYIRKLVAKNCSIATQTPSRNTPPGMWKFEDDGSVSQGSPLGGEIISPILTDCPETWRTIEKICEVVRRHNGRVNERCGGHIHFGMEPLDTARQRWKRFFRAIAGYEDVIYRLAGGSLGRIRSGHTRYATPFAQRATQGARTRLELNNDYDVRQMTLNVSQDNRYTGINLTNIHRSNRPNTVEYRYFNSSLNPAQLQANVRIANGILMASEKARIRDYPEDGILTSESMKRRGQILREQPLGQIERDNHNGIKKLIDVIFTRKKDKDAALAVYAKNNWRT